MNADVRVDLLVDRPCSSLRPLSLSTSRPKFARLLLTGDQLDRCRLAPTSVLDAAVATDPLLTGDDNSELTSYACVPLDRERAPTLRDGE